MRNPDVIIIGGGQAGLAMSRSLTLAGVDHAVLERGRIGERWHSERWHSLNLLTTASFSALPGLPIAIHVPSAPGCSSSTSAAAPDARVPTNRACLTRVLFTTSRSPAGMNSGKSPNLRSSSRFGRPAFRPSAPTITSIRLFPRSAAGSCAISSGGSSYSNADVG